MKHMNSKYSNVLQPIANFKTQEDSNIWNLKQRIHLVRKKETTDRCRQGIEGNWNVNKNIGPAHNCIIIAYTTKDEVRK